MEFWSLMGSYDCVVDTIDYSNMFEWLILECVMTRIWYLCDSKRIVIQR